jgi:phosphatidylinositol alpha-mannosyltransferase
MKIAITSLYLPSSSKIGVGYQVHYLANALVSRGHDVTVFSQATQPADAHYKVVTVPSGRHLRTFGFAWNLRKVDFTPFDVLNAHGDDWFLWGRPRPRHVHTYHGSCLAEALHAKGLVARARMAALAVCEYGSCFLAEELVTVSENTKRYVPLIKHVIPCGVDTHKFHPGEKSAEPALLFVGTMHGRKRGRMLLDMFEKQIRPRVPGVRFWAVCEERIEGPQIDWFGRAPLEQLTELFRKAWVFCLPSTYEGFGVPYVEAMASGTAVVASPNVGAREVTRQGKCGRVLSDDTLADGIIELLTNETQRTALAQAGLVRSVDFSWERVCSRYEALFVSQNSPLPAPEKP